MSGKLKEVRDRIGSIVSTQQITSAMKMVSAAKLKKAQDAITQLRPYANRLNDILIHILTNLKGDINLTFADEREADRVLVVVVTSNRGLCGAFNANIIQKAVHKIENDYSHVRSGGKLDFICIGKKGHEYFSKHYSDCRLVNDYSVLFDDLSFDNVSAVADELMDYFVSKDYDRIEVAYGLFKNAAIQYSTLDQFLPVDTKNSSDNADTSQYLADYIFEPEKEKLLNELIPNILRTTFHRYLLDTNASEHGARMTAMENASENAKEMMKDLKLEYNKARQESITKELLEIVSGAAALE